MQNHAETPVERLNNKYVLFRTFSVTKKINTNNTTSPPSSHRTSNGIFTSSIHWYLYVSNEFITRERPGKVTRSIEARTADRL